MVRFPRRKLSFHVPFIQKDDKEEQLANTKDFVPVNEVQEHRYEGKDKTEHVQDQIQDVTGIMQQNIDKVVQRGENLQNLESKSEGLEHSSHMFQKKAHKVERKMWWKSKKYTIILIVIVTIIILITLGSLVL